MSEYQNPQMNQDLVDAVTQSDAAASGLAGQATRSKLSGLRTFITPQEPNTRFLVVHGKLGLPQIVGGVILKHAEREGDKWAHFINGVCTTDDDDIIEWLEAHTGDPGRHQAYYAARGLPAPKMPHYGFCRDINTPGVEGWAELKANQQALAWRPATISPGLNVDKMFAGEAADISYRDVKSEGQDFVDKGRNNQAVQEGRRVVDESYRATPA